MTRILCLAVFVCVVQCLPMSQDELEDFSNFLLKTSSLDIHVKTGADPDASLDEDEVVSDDAWENSGKFEGDLILNDRQRRLIVENVEGLSRNGLTDSTKRWPNNEVIYFIQREHFTSGQVQAIQAGIDDLAQASCVKFRPYRRGDRDAVVIQGSRRGCFSQVGYQGGYQVLNLSGRHPVGRGCFRHGTVVHELLHSLGFYHMQSSPDRDDYIDVVWANIVQPARHNFRKYNSFSVSDFGVGYDYDSVLHYSRRAFSANGQDTLVPKKSGVEIGQRVGLSDKDTQKLNKMYCDAENDPGIQADDNTTKKPKQKKKKPKNQPFEGHGIGYHQGKTVVIKLPTAEIHKLPNVPSTHVFDFSKTPQVVSPEVEGYRFGEEITYSYKPITLNFSVKNSYKKPGVTSTVNKDTEKVAVTKEKTKPLEGNKENQSALHHSNKVIPEYVPIDEYDKDLNDAFDRLSQIVQQHIYPHEKGYDYRINKDYSQFSKPIKYQNSELLENIEEPKSYGSLILKPIKPIEIAETLSDNIRNNQIQDRMDSSFRTLLPTKKPYSSYEQTETPSYATLEYLKDRHDYSAFYSQDSPNDNTNKDSSADKYKYYIKVNPYDQGLYTDEFYANKKDHFITPLQKNEREEVHPSEYEQKSSKKLQLKEETDISYRTLLPTRKPYSANEQTETPIYATLDYLIDRHDISNIYQLKKKENETKNKPYTISKNVPSPNKEEWYVKDSSNHNNPINYDRDAYTDNLSLKTKPPDKYDDTEETEKSAEESSPNGHLKDIPDDYNEYQVESTDPQENEKLKFNKNHNDDANIEQGKSKYDEGYVYDHLGEKRDDDYSLYFDEPKTETLYSPYVLHESPRRIGNQYSEFVKDYDIRSPDEGRKSKKPPKKNEAYYIIY